MNFNKNIFEPKNQTFNKIKKTNKNSQFILLPTSGTTGKAKVVALSQKSTYVSVKVFNEKMNIKKSHYINKTVILITPYFASYGIMMVLWCLLNKVKLVVYNDTFSFSKICQLIEKHKITFYEGGASFVYWLEKMSPEKINYDISSLEYAGFGGSKVQEKPCKRQWEITAI